MKQKATFLNRYLKAKDKLLSDSAICRENRELFSKFFEEEEYKLKRIRNLRALDEGNAKTLYAYVRMFKNANRFFNNKSWIKLTKEDIKKVYDDLEDGIILNRYNKPYQNLSGSYYSKVFKSRPFELAGKIELAKEVIKYTGNNNKEDVRFIQEESFRIIVNSSYKQHHRVLLWLCWDIGENINAILQLKKNDFLRQNNPYTKEPEYRINLRKEILKRSRKARSEITNYPETVELLDLYLKGLEDGVKLFDFEYANAKKIINRLVEKTEIKCIPGGQRTTWKDLRSGMACDLLKKGWTTDEVNARLGHKPSSDEIDKYVNFLAIDRHRPKKKVQQFEMERLNEELQEVKRAEKLQLMRNEELNNQLSTMQKTIDEKSKKDDVVYRFLKGLVDKGKLNEAVDIVHDENLEKELLKLSG